MFSLPLVDAPSVWGPLGLAASLAAVAGVLLARLEARIGRAPAEVRRLPVARKTRAA